MFYHPETKKEYATTYEFRLAYSNTSFGELENEAERNYAGLYRIEIEMPSSDGIYGYYTADGVTQIDGIYKRRWKFEPHPPDMIRHKLKEAVTAKRWNVETSGVLLPSGVRVSTDTSDQNRISNVITNATASGLTTVDFKASTGWVTLTIDEIKGIATAIALHVQSCFSAERIHHAAIDALSDANLQNYNLNAHWPG